MCSKSARARNTAFQNSPPPYRAAPRRFRYGGIHLLDFYRFTGSHCGFELLSYQDLTPHPTQHYARVLEEMDALVARDPAARDPAALDAAYVERARPGLQRWVDGGREGHLTWGVVHFRL